MTSPQTNPPRTDTEDATPSWCRLFTAGSGARDLTPCDSLAAARAALEGRAARVVVLYQPPVEALAGLLLEAAAPAQALARWKAACQALLALLPGHRRQMILMEEPPAGQAADQAAAVLAEATGGAGWPGAVARAPQVQDLVPLAGLLVDRDAGLRAMIDQLQAASRGAYAELPPAMALFETALAAWQHALSEAAHARQGSGPMHNLLSDQVMTLEGALRDTTAQFRAAEAQSAARAADALSALENQLAARDKQVAALEKQVAAQDKQAAAQEKQVAARDKQATAQRAGLQQQIGALTADRDGQKRHVQRLQGEIAQLGSDLQSAQAAHQSAVTAHQEALSREADSGRMLQGLARQTTDLQTALAAADREKALINQEKLKLDSAYRKRVAALSAMLDAVYKSSSWRITGPVRSVMRRIRR